MVCAMPNLLLNIHNRTFEEDHHSILDWLDLTIDSQEIHAFLDTNGSGKTRRLTC